MDVKSCGFALGDFGCWALMDGSISRPLGHLFANVSKSQIQEGSRRYTLPAGYVTTPCIHLYVDTGQHRVLVDMGAGRVTIRTGRLRHNMEAAGIEPAGIDTVVITHAHPGHVGGTLDDRGRPVYAHAHYYMSKDEWEFWTSESAFSKAPDRQVAIARANLQPVYDRLTLLDGEGEIVPGIRALPAPGHTPGHLVVSVSSAGQRLLYLADAAFHPLHLEHPDWYPIYDILPGQAEASRRAILDWVARARILVMGHHLTPFPGLGYVVKAEEEWEWRPGPA